MTEERFRAQFADATDLVTILNAAGVILYASASHEGLLGQTPADLEGRPAVEFMHPDDVPRVQEALSARVQDNERPQPVELRWRHVDGSWRWLEAMVTNKLHDPAVGGLIVIVTSRDITKRRRAEERLMLQYAISVILAGSATLDQAIPNVLQTLCERNGWDVALFWRVDLSEGVLRCQHTWPLQAALARLSREFTFASGVELPGRVWASREPIWITDIVTDGTFGRALVALKDGLHTACAFPIVGANAVHGVVEIFSREIRAPEAALVQGLTTIGAHIGQFLERTQVEELLHAAEARLRHVVDHVPVVVFALDRDGVVTLAEGRGLEALGRLPGACVGRSVFDACHEVPEVLTQMQRALAGEAFTATVTIGGVLCEIRYTPRYDTAGQIAGVMGVSVEITERKELEEALQHQALHDALTDLPNRTLFLDRLQQAMHAARRDHEPLALLLLDLNGFKEINATFGHHYGDLLLQQVAGRLHSVVRASDTVARLGGDEFAVVLPGADAAPATVAAGRILQTLEQPVTVDGHSLHSGGSIGIAIYPDHGDDEHSLLQHADVAMYSAKRQGADNVVYDPAQDPHSPSKLLFIGDLQRAIYGHQLLLHYQPRVHLRTGHVDGAEALVRWQHPQHGLLLPGQFVSLAEHAGLIRPLSRWVLHEAVRQCAAWQEQGLGVQVVVNLPVQDLYDPDLERMIVGVLERWELPPARLAVEITESGIMTNPDHAMQAITRLHAHGVRTAIDDFGMGYSSLAYLKHLPVDEIKIDRSFVRDMTVDASDAIIVYAVVDLGHKLGLQVVAEGVENRETMEALAKLGCDYAQGYYVSRPLPVPESTTWLSQRGPLSDPGAPE
jgi:diguanylate cyclase (GGDEF)-like protein/PAS domain S-box-containing protein